MSTPAIGALQEDHVAVRRGDRSAAGRVGPSVVAGSVAGLLLLWLAWDAGGYFPSSYLAAGTIALLTCGALLVATRPRYALSTEALFALTGLSALALWTGLSSLWSPAPSAALDAMQRDLGYVGFLGLGMLAAGSGRHARQIVWLALTITTIICCGGLVARLFPGLIEEPANTSYRLAYPLTYANALGGLAAVGAVLGFGLAADPRTRPALRSAAAVSSVLLVVTMTLSLSRGSWMALFAGLAVLVAFGAHRGSFLVTSVVVGLGWVAAVAALQTHPALTDAPTLGAGQAAAGRVYALELALICVAVGTAIAFVALARSSAHVTRQVQRVARPAALAGAGLVVLLLVIGYGARAAGVEGAAARSTNDAQDWISRQWDDFMAPAGEAYVGATGTTRITSGSGGTRSDVYRVALDGFGRHPLYGDGAGSFRVHWLAERPIAESVVNAHSLEIETVSELGIVGGAFLALFLGSIAYAAVRSRRKPGALARSQTAAVAGACSAWVVHSAFDWDWQMPALTGVVLLLACTLFPTGRRRRRRGAARA